MVLDYLPTLREIEWVVHGKRPWAEAKGGLAKGRGHYGGMGSVHNYGGERNLSNRSSEGSHSGEAQRRQNLAQNAQESHQNYEQNAQQSRQNFGQNVNAESSRQTAKNNGNNSGKNYTASNYESNYGYQGYGGGWYGKGWYGSWDGYYAGIATAAAAGLAVGETVASVPEQSTVVVVDGNTYYYSDGVYYEPKGNSYTVVPPSSGSGNLFNP